MALEQEFNEAVRAFRLCFCRSNNDRVAPLPPRHGQAVVAFVSIWQRGGGKSTSVEFAVAHFVKKQNRRYGL